MFVEEEKARNMRSLAGGPVCPQSNAARSQDGNGYARLKAVMDIVLALALMALAAPLVIIAALMVKLTSRGPAFYSQTRLGLRGRPYTLYKIRTMRHNCEHLTGPCWSVLGDPRITRVGRFLRRTHLDELPQLWNVLRGEMSLVGPRPERPEFVAGLEVVVPYYRARLAVRPGMTGLAQVQLPADTDLASVRRKLAYDLYYVRQLSLWLDVRVLASTVLYVWGVPFPALCRLFWLPGREAVERVYEKWQAQAEPAPQLQPA